MNDIEQLVRESLQSAPMPETTVTDPVSAVTRRVARARALIAASVVAVAVVVTAAVVVPMQAAGHDDHGRINITVPPSPQPTRAAGHSAQTWWPKGSVQVTVGGGSMWHLRRDTKPNSQLMYVDELNPVNHALRGRWKVSEPADFIAYGLDRVWVWGGGDGGFPDGLLQSVDPTNGDVASWSNTREAFNAVAFANGRAWVATGRQIWQLDVSRHTAIVSRTTLPAATMQRGLVTTDGGQLWVRTTKSWLRIDPATHRVVDSVSWDGPMLGSAGDDAIWTYDGRLIALTPALLHQGVSVAEGSRVAVPGPVSAVASSSDGGLFVVAADGPDLSSATSRLYYLSERTLTGTAAVTAETPSVADAPYQLAPDDAGGVNYSDSDVGMRWSP